MALTAAEQFAFELINRARLDPLAEAERYNLDLNANLSPGTITADAKQVVSPNAVLETAAEDHSIWMLDQNIFSHTGDGGSSPGDRMAAAGYEFTGRWAWRENLAWSGTTGTLSLAAAIETHHEGLYRSEGHRENTFGENSKELGLAQVEGQFRSSGTTFNASMLTLNYAATGYNNYVTGVAYRDTDGDDFYSIGEGIDGIVISVDGKSAETADAGGYGVEVSKQDQDVTLSLGTTVLATLRVDVTDHNAKLDYVQELDGETWLELSSSADLISGIRNAKLLGVGDLDLSGTTGADQLVGNKGNNVLEGGAGDDLLSGGAGIDRLYGGAGDDVLEGGDGRDTNWDDPSATPASSGNADVLEGQEGNDTLIGLSGTDLLDGGAGDDIMTGGGGRDTFVFDGGNDRITDFAKGVDALILDQVALGLSELSEETLAEIMSFEDGDLILAFEDATLTLEGITNAGGLFNDIDVA